jgi:hypothetical protein
MLEMENMGFFLNPARQIRRSIAPTLRRVRRPTHALNTSRGTFGRLCPTLPKMPSHPTDRNHDPSILYPHCLSVEAILRP